MISEQRIKELVQQTLVERGHFLVDVKVSPFNKINVLIDNINGIKINDCVELSRFIESNLNRDEEDFELEVSSPGLDQPFKVLKQYQKYIGKKVDVVTKEGQKVTGELLSATDNGIELMQFLNKKTNNNKQTITNLSTSAPAKGGQFIPFDKIKETKVLISFN